MSFWEFDNTVWNERILLEPSFTFCAKIMEKFVPSCSEYIYENVNITTDFVILLVCLMSWNWTFFLEPLENPGNGLKFIYYLLLQWWKYNGSNMSNLRWVKLLSWMIARDSRKFAPKYNKKDQIVINIIQKYWISERKQLVDK